jgi:maleate cis-trans isomerase
MNDDMYGYRARIGYTSPPATTEVFPYEFYATVPKGVTLVLATLAIMARTQEEVDQSWEISLKAARNMGKVGVDFMIHGGLPINISRGIDKVEALIRDTQAEIGCPVSTSVTAQVEALRAVGAKKIAIAHPEGPSADSIYTDVLEYYGLGLAGVTGAQKMAIDLGRIPLRTSVELSRGLKRDYPDCDVIWLPCPHWASGEVVDMIEKELGVTVITANQAIVWQALRHLKITDPLKGYGKLFERF